MPLRRKLKEKRGSCIQRNPLNGREISWDRGELQELRGELSNWSVAGRTE